jgi:hypothetical protein
MTDYEVRLAGTNGVELAGGRAKSARKNKSANKKLKTEAIADKPKAKAAKPTFKKKEAEYTVIEPKLKPKAKAAKIPRKVDVKRKSGEAWGSTIAVQKKAPKKSRPDKPEIKQEHPTLYGGGCLVMWGSNQCHNKAASGSHLCEHHTTRMAELNSKSTTFNGFFLDVGGYYRDIEGNAHGLPGMRPAEAKRHGYMAFADVQAMLKKQGVEPSEFNQPSHKARMARNVTFDDEEGLTEEGELSSEGDMTEIIPDSEDENDAESGPETVQNSDVGEDGDISDDVVGERHDCVMPPMMCVANMMSTNPLTHDDNQTIDPYANTLDQTCIDDCLNMTPLVEHDSNDESIDSLACIDDTDDDVFQSGISNKIRASRHPIKGGVDANEELDEFSAQ